MKTKNVLVNEYDSRKGFQTVTFGSYDERIAKYREWNHNAQCAMMRRLKLKSGKMRISTFLMRTKIPQVFGKFLMPRAEKACALGALQIGAGGKFTDEEIKWWMVKSKFDVFDQEWSRHVKCPQCYERNCLSAIIYHLNDVHKMSNYNIGRWLRKYHL